MAGSAEKYASRGGLKLEAALNAWGDGIAGAVCADLGCNVGGFTDCLLQYGASRVYAVDTGYGTLAWKLRQDSRVIVMERTNALHTDPWTIAGFTGVDVVTIDLAWTRQERAIPAALAWLRKSSLPPPATSGTISGLSTSAVRHGCIVTLIKPHYEADRQTLARANRGVLDPADAKRVADEVLASLPALGVRVLGCIESPILGGAGKGKRGNVEYLALLERADQTCR